MPFLSTSFANAHDAPRSLSKLALTLSEPSDLEISWPSWEPLTWASFVLPQGYRRGQVRITGESPSPQALHCCHGWEACKEERCAWRFIACAVQTQLGSFLPQEPPAQLRDGTQQPSPCFSPPLTACGREAAGVSDPAGQTCKRVNHIGTKQTISCWRGRAGHCQLIHGVQGLVLASLSLGSPSVI